MGGGPGGRGARVLIAILAAAALCLALAGGAAAQAPGAPQGPTAPVAPTAPASPTAPSVPGASPSGSAVAGPAGVNPSGGAAGSVSAGAAVGATVGLSPAVAGLVGEAMDHLPTARLNAVLDAVARESGGTAVPSLADTVKALASGRLPLSPTAFLQLVARAFAREVGSSAGLLGKLVVLAVGAALLDLLGRSLGRDEAARFGATVVHLALVALALGSFTVAFALARTIVGDLGDLMDAVLPLMVGLLAAMGAVTSAALFQPLVLAATAVVEHVVASVALPLLYLGGVLDVVGRVTPYRLGGVAGMVRSAGLWILGGVLTAFLGVIVVAGSLGPVSDGLTLKAGKFLANAFIPVVGKMFSDAAEMVMGTSLLLKNAVGAVGVIALLIVLVLPITKLLALSFSYRLAGAAVAPVGGGPVPDILGTMGTTLVFVTVAVAIMAMMCFIALAALLAAGSAGVLP